MFRNCEYLLMSLVEICKETRLLSTHVIYFNLHYLSLKFVNITLENVTLKNFTLLEDQCLHVLLCALCNVCVGAVEQSF